jgi:hypothetical protein
VEALLPHKYLFTICIIEKTTTLSKSAKQKVFVLGMKLDLYLCQTHTNTQKKLQVAAIFRDNAI